jgi:hypothetical protein
MQPKARPRTTEQVLKQQARDAERNRVKPAAKQDGIERLTAEPATAVVPAASLAVTVPDTRSSVQKVLDEVAPANIVDRTQRAERDDAAADYGGGIIISQRLQTR